jgi:hypothetical protein
MLRNLINYAKLQNQETIADFLSALDFIEEEEGRATYE